MAKGRAKMAMGQGLGVWVLEAPHGFGDAAFHAHHAIQITAALSGALSLTGGGETLCAPVLAVAADARHRFEAHGLLAFVFVEPESRAGRRLGAALFAGWPLVPIDDAALAAALDPLRATFDAPLDAARLLAAGRAAVEAIAPAGEPQLPDPRIRRILDFAATNLDRPLSLADAAEGVYLSPSRLRHLFVEQTGLAFRTYLLWLRLVRAVQLYSEGSSLTDAAHAAGFSDSAHFSRIFRRTFGLPATTLTRL
ncbi:MAG: helix-turn-helix transcriptional regulator [Allosphingosinicella sp.]